MANTYSHDNVGESFNTLNAILNLVEFGTWDWSKSTGQAIRSPGWFSMLGYDINDYAQDIFTWENIIHQDDYDYVMSNIGLLISGKIDLYDVEYRCQKYDGTYLWIRDKAKVISYDETGFASRIIGYHTNIHEHKTIQLKLKHCEKLLNKDKHSLKVYALKKTQQLQKKIDELKDKILKVEQLSNADTLTKIPNRKGFEEQLTKEIARAIRYQHTLSFVIFDIDFFKLINDQFGHKAGDIVLKKIATVARTTIREIDYLARWGGEEFVLILPCLSILEAAKVCESLRKAITHLKTSNNITITCSFGVTEFLITDNRNSLFSRADNALYKAKKSGRNCVVTSGQEVD